MYLNWAHSFKDKCNEMTTNSKQQGMDKDKADRVHAMKAFVWLAVQIHSYLEMGGPHQAMADVPHPLTYLHQPVTFHFLCLFRSVHTLIRVMQHTSKQNGTLWYIFLLQILWHGLSSTQILALTKPSKQTWSKPWNVYAMSTLQLSKCFFEDMFHIPVWPHLAG